MSYASCLASCSVVLLSDVFHSTLTKFSAAQLDLSCSPYWSPPCPRIWGLQPLLSRVFCIAPWDSLSGLCASWDSLSGFLNL